jgi:H+/Cl- antiporter ClcA
LVVGGAGLLIGLIRFAVNYPDDLPGLFKEIYYYHVDAKWAPWTLLISTISLSGGATLGPEAALGNVGGGIGKRPSQLKELRRTMPYLLLLCAL